MNDYVSTGSILDKILARKVTEIGERKSYISFAELRAYVKDVSASDPTRDFIAALRGDTVRLIAEVKQASPSKGVLIEDFDPVRIGTVYAENGAAAISVLTDKPFFQGDLQYLYDVRSAVNVPVLCKDFIIDPYQVYAARAAGADAALLIVAALTDEQLQSLHDTISEIKMTPLVEVHNEAELERALNVGARLIGVNNRDLRTFNVDLATTERLAQLMPEDVTLVAESGISSAADVRRMGELGANAVLVGESLVKAADMAVTVRLYSNQPFEPGS